MASEACRIGLQQEASGWVRPDVGYTRSVFEAGQAGGGLRVGSAPRGRGQRADVVGAVGGVAHGARRRADRRADGAAEALPLQLVDSEVEQVVATGARGGGSRVEERAEDARDVGVGAVGGAVVVLVD